MSDEVHRCPRCGATTTVPPAPEGQHNYCVCPKCQVPMQPPFRGLDVAEPNRTHTRDNF